MNITVTVSYIETADYDQRIRQLVELLLNSNRTPKPETCQKLTQPEGDYDPENGAGSGDRAAAGRPDIGSD